MTVTEAIERRRSIRAFTDAPVDRAVLDRVLATAQRSASGGNLQPWQATVVTGAAWDALKADVAAALSLGAEGQSPEYTIYPPNLSDPWNARRRGVGEALYAALDIARDNRIGRAVQMAANFTGFGAPVMLFLHCDRTMGPPQWGDMGIWLQSVMLLLTEAGLDSCPQEAWAMYGAQVRRAIGLGDEQILWTGLAIGHADLTAPVNRWAVPRAPLSESIRWVGEAA